MLQTMACLGAVQSPSSTQMILKAPGLLPALSWSAQHPQYPSPLSFRLQQRATMNHLLGQALQLRCRLRCKGQRPSLFPSLRRARPQMEHVPWLAGIWSAFCSYWYLLCCYFMLLSENWDAYMELGPFILYVIVPL